MHARLTLGHSSGNALKGPAGVIDDLRLDATAPVFFVSHARDGSVLSPLIARFFDDLSTNVNELLPLATGHQPGFIDTNMVYHGRIIGVPLPKSD